MTFKYGWKWTKHAKTCVPVQGAGKGPPKDSSFPNKHIEFYENHGEQCEEMSPVEEEHYPTDVEVYMSNLSEKGTIDSNYILSYMDIPHRKLTDSEFEVCEFLRSLDSGTGVSLASIQGSLDYVRRWERCALLLPKTAKQCWNIIEKVNY